MKQPYEDMSVAACMARYEAERESILASIRRGDVSASMSGIDYYPCPARDLDPSKDVDGYIIKTALRWDGVKRIDRPNWRAEFDAWRLMTAA